MSIIKPTILQINVTANWGSTGKIAEQIGQLVLEKGWDSYIAYGRMMNPSKSRLIRIGSQIDVYYHYAQSRFFDAEGLSSKRATRKLIKEIKQIQPDIVHLHNIHDHYLNYPLLFSALKELDIPVVWTQHDLWAVTGSCYYIPDNCDKWKDHCNRCPLRKGIIDRSYQNYSLKRHCFLGIDFLTIVPVSNWLNGLIKESFLGNCNVNIIHNGIDTGVFKPCIDKYEGKKIVLGIAAVWEKRKGLGDLYHLSELLPFDEFEIIIVGKIIDKPLQSHHQSCNMEFIDRTQNINELVNLYSKAFVLVNPTYQDNYPTTNLEAMACGTPVITYNTGGSPEAVTTDTGWVVEQGNVRRIADIIKNMALENTKQLYARRTACRNRAEEYFSKDKCFSKYIELYENLIYNNHRSKENS